MEPRKTNIDGVFLTGLGAHASTAFFREQLRPDFREDPRVASPREIPQIDPAFCALVHCLEILLLLQGNSKFSNLLPKKQTAPFY